VIIVHPSAIGLDQILWPSFETMLANHYRPSLSGSKPPREQ
jgi:hypothetical protein